MQETEPAMSLNIFPVVGVRGTAFVQSVCATAKAILAARAVLAVAFSVAATIALGLCASAQQVDAPVDELGYKLASDAGSLSSVYAKQVVFLRTNETAGTILVDTKNRFLYLVQLTQSSHSLRHRRRARRL